jgi:hypothetical protein
LARSTSEDFVLSGFSVRPDRTAMGDAMSNEIRKPPLCSKCGRRMQLDRIVPRVLYHSGEKTYVCRPCREVVSVPDEK